MIHPVCARGSLCGQIALSARAAILMAAVIGGCRTRVKQEPPLAPPRPVADTRPFAKLSQYNLFAGELKAQQPASGVIPYDLNSALFSDYADKYRFVKLPPGAHATFSADSVFAFPVGTVIAKTFAFPRDARDPTKGRRLIETRILKHNAEGWVGLPYIWNAEQTDATLDVAGDTVDVSWIHTDGRTRINNYIVPNANQCKGCHKAGETMTPIGPKARNLNRDFAYQDGTENQLAHWGRLARSRVQPTLMPRRGSPTGLIPRAAHSTPELGHGWKSIVRIATIPEARRVTRVSTSWPRSITRPHTASRNRR